MTREQVVITQVRITKAGQVKHFQVKLPKNAKRIIGVELSARGLLNDRASLVAAPPKIEPVREVIGTYADGAATGVEGSKASAFFQRNILIGEVKLQSCEEANLFYAGYLQLDQNLSLGDFSQSRFWTPSVFTHQAQSFEEVVIVDAESTIIQGICRDQVGEQNKTDYNYLISVYVWIEIEEPELKK
ncbi:MAG: hypothetical protein ACJ77K_08080 [Bacteroidia bacterium]